MKSCDAKRRRQRRRERWKTTIGLISKRATLHVQHTIFCTFLCRCFPRLQRETSRNFLVTRFLQGMSHVLSFIFFSLPLIFTFHGGRLHFSFSHHRYKIFMVFSQQKKCLLCFLLSPKISVTLFSRWPSLVCRLLSLFLCLSLSLYSKFAGMIINLRLIL